MIDNALWGFVQPRGGWSAFAERVQKAEAADTAVSGSTTDTATLGQTRYEVDRESSDIPDSLSAVVNDPRGDMLAGGEAGQSSLVPVFERRSFIDDICFGGESFDSCLETLDRLLSRSEECRISVSITKSMFVQPTVDFLSHAVSRERLRADAKKLKAITELSFPKTKNGVQAFIGALTITVGSSKTLRSMVQPSIRCARKTLDAMGTCPLLDEVSPHSKQKSLPSLF
ncbi:unnamed protein product [Phytophthora fragariaefolia]|uniref:Unnamed protein product n=1 Tax=Phytophthora fragariaefolia TaxID=1490495 RepID=A0A9W6XFD8_9STRA|nr:unnamed protein product [Phytophthora fragariaefolia]